LDFGCGSGAGVYEFRDLGFDACGFDIFDFLVLRKPDDRRLFHIAANAGSFDASFEFDWSSYKLPFDDGTFDLVVSQETFEHVQDHEGAMRELARVTKRPGLAIHSFPARYRLIEPHINVPLGGIIRSYWWYLFWAKMGIRNEFQRGFTTEQTASANLKYATHGLNYQSTSSILRVGRLFYDVAELVPQQWEYAPNRSRLWFPGLYSQFKHVILLLEKLPKESPGEH
jgi:SAM-dependent methyltransferase